MLPTPDTSHVANDRVYEPAEDSFLFLDTLSSASETAFLTDRFPDQELPPPLVLLEVGSGSGVVVAFLTAHAARIFGSRSVLSLAVDANGFACGATRATVAKAVRDAGAEEEAGESEQTKTGAGAAACFLDVVQGDLMAPVRRRIVDVLVFNPPYVPSDKVPGLHPGRDDSDSQSPSYGLRHPPTSRPARDGPEAYVSFEEESRLLRLAVSGGRDGMETTDRLLAALPETLSPKGCAYVLFCAQNRPEQIKARIRGGDFYALGSGWRAETVGTSRDTAGWEKLQIVRVWRDHEPKPG